MNSLCHLYLNNIALSTALKSLFAKLDEAKQKAQDALDSFETRKPPSSIKPSPRAHRPMEKKEENTVWGWRVGGNSHFQDACLKITDGTHHSPSIHQLVSTCM